MPRNNLIESSRSKGNARVCTLSFVFHFTYFQCFSLTCSYENARQQVDLIFGQKFHPSFPRVLKSCDQSGCGNYPATLGGVYNEGIEVVASSSNVVPSPLSGYVQLLNARWEWAKSVCCFSDVGLIMS